MSAEIKKITEVEVANFVDPESDPAIYVEMEGNIRRVKGKNAREAIGLGGIVVSDGMLCIETDV